jgi:basic amino acid/polyamine antiporter, APA family
LDSAVTTTVRDQGTAPKLQPSLIRGLSLFDSVMLLVGGIIGSAIFLTPRDVAAALPSPALFLAVWVAGGAISMLAAFAFAELGAMYPQAGGPYVYLREAYGDLVAFLYGWMIFTVNNGGTVAAISVAFASYLAALVPAISAEHVLLRVGAWQLTRVHLVALAANAVLTIVNVVGLRRAAVLQNVATWMKYTAMAVFVVLGFAIGKGSLAHFFSAGASLHSAGYGALFSGFGVALIAVLWAYDGWVYVTWAAGEVKRPERNLPLALIIGILLVAAVYVAMNVVYLYGIDVAHIAGGEQTTARAVAETLFSTNAGRWLSALIALSCFGALSSCVLSGARVYFAMARDGVFFRSMARVHPRWHTPALSLLAQAIWGAILTLSIADYDRLFTYLMFMGVVSYALTVAALFILRRTRPDVARPYRCTGYPFLPAIYLVIATLWALNTLWQRPLESLLGIGIVLVGVPFYFYWRHKGAGSVAGA